MTITTAFVKPVGWDEIAKPKGTFVNTILVKTAAFAPIKTIRIIVHVLQDTLDPIVNSPVAPATAHHVATVVLASITATEPNSLVFAPLEPQAKLANKTRAMNALTILAKMALVSIVWVTMIATVKSNGAAKIAICTTKQALAELTKPTEDINSLMFIKKRPNVSNMDANAKPAITVVMKNATLIFADTMVEIVGWVSILGNIAMRPVEDRLVGMYFKMDSVTRLAIPKNVCLMDVTVTPQVDLNVTPTTTFTAVIITAMVIVMLVATTLLVDGTVLTANPLVNIIKSFPEAFMSF